MTYRRGVGQTGFVLLGVVGLWIAYLVPHRLRFRQQLADARVDDRFSGRLRVLAVGSGEPRPTGGTPPAARVLLHPHRALSSGGHMERPHGTKDRIAAEAARRDAAAHAHRTAHLARRKAAARRRALLSAVLLLATVGGWVAGPLLGGGAALLWGAVPTALLATVLVTGRRAVVAGQRADAAWAARNVDRVVLPAGERAVLVRPSPAAGVVGRAVRGSETDTQIMARVAEEGRAEVARVAREERAAARAAEAARLADAPAATSGTWVPVPVPRPAYTLKPEARRAEPAPLPVEEAVVTSDPGQAVDLAAPADATAPESPARVDLDAVLRRRRAAGE